MSSDDLHARAERWIADDPDETTREELRAILSRPDVGATDLDDRFAGTLEFGTAGLRGVLGAGPNRMNRAVVARATWGLARELLAGVDGSATLATRTVVVGGDARRLSREFADDVAAILGAAGFRVVLFAAPVPTPLVGFAVKHSGAAAGVVVTASHNPPEYSGYKVYWSNGAQIVPPVDSRIADAIGRAPPAREVPRPALATLRAQGMLAEAPPVLERDYLDAILALRVHPRRGDQTLGIVYTPLHGVGDMLARRALCEAGFSNVVSVPEQQQPDGAFPTVSFPNPEEAGAMDLAFALGRRTGAEILLANDPDADRLAVAVREPTSALGYRQLTGNEVGALLGHYLLTEKASARPRAVLASIVSSPLLGRIASSLGVHYEETLTGFKWIANRAIELAANGYDFVFGYEEALGYAVGEAVYDKDGISAALLVAELAAVLRGEGRTLCDELDAIARRWGAHVSAQLSLTRKGASGAAAIREMMYRLRASPPSRWAGDEVVALSDYDAGMRTDRRARAESPIALPPSNVLAFELASGARVIVRPSGTEPKAKFYFDVREEVRANESVQDAAARAHARIALLEDAASAIAGEAVH